MPRKSSDIKTVAFVNLGCVKNLVDSERMLGLLAEDGIIVTSDAAQADAIVINTCGFLEASKVESLAEIQRAVDFKRTGRCRRVVVAGCLVQRHKTKLLEEAPGIDRLVGVFDRDHIVRAVRGVANPSQPHGHYLGKYHDLSARQGSPKRLALLEDDRARLRLTPRHYAYVRISEGCNQGCGFCTIPSIRGPLRSKPVDRILAEAAELLGDGAVELILIGQDTTSYGTDIGYEPGLAGLLRTLDRELSAARWLRLMYVYPSCFTDGMIDALAESARFVKYIDMPLQHINDRMLTMMKRRVTRKQIETLLGKLRDRIPGITLRTTLISGSPGETDAEHEELLKFVKDFGFDMLGVFTYSQEPGTPMGRMEDQLPEAVKEIRREELMLAQQEIAFERARAKIGRRMDILLDKQGDEEDVWIGRSTAQAPDIDSVTYIRGTDLAAGEMVEAKVVETEGYDLIADAVGKRESLSV